MGELAPVAAKRFYEVHEVGDNTLGRLAENILQRVKPLGQNAVLVIENLTKEVSRIAIGTGAITYYREMLELGADVLLVTDDGTRLWESRQWALDHDVPLIMETTLRQRSPGCKPWQDSFKIISQVS